MCHYYLPGTLKEQRKSFNQHETKKQTNFLTNNCEEEEEEEDLIKTSAWFKSQKISTVF